MMARKSSGGFGWTISCGFHILCLCQYMVVWRKTCLGVAVWRILVSQRDNPHRFWYAQADGDFFGWARAHASGMEVSITDPDVFVSQVQGPNSLKILEAAAGALPEKFTYFACTQVELGGQDVVVTRTGYTNELGWEFYTEPHHDSDALWAHLQRAGAGLGMEILGLDAMNIRRIEAGILNAGSDFNETTTPYAAGLGRFVDADKFDFIGKAALEAADKG
ncbi:MAG: aminomethyl transferase family protein, partial [Boseongicola sp. SB0676_bin_33]|nr:aminomethyl transferase family protein [Boseongicola sp. SB0676_bin_33]